MHHKRKLNFKHFKNNKKDSIWSLFWYGRIFFNKSKSKFFIEAYFVKLNTDNYYLNSIDKNRIEKLEFPFSKSVLFPLCSQFESNGKFIKMSNAYDDNGNPIKNGLYVFDDVSFSNNDFRISNLENILSDTLFPNIKENGLSIYENASYFIVEKYKYKYIIPIDVILKYFFGYSSLLLYFLISNRLKSCVFKKPFDEDPKQKKLFYKSKQISRFDVSTIAKYYFTKKDYAEKMISGIGAYFNAVMVNDYLPQRSFIKFKIPFDFTCHFKIVGQYITASNSDNKIVMVNEILQVRGEEDFFLTNEEIDIIDMDSSQVNNNDEKDSESGNNNGNAKPIKDPNLNGDDVKDEMPLDQEDSDEIINNPVILRNTFNLSPKINPLVQHKDEEGNESFFDDRRPDDHPDFPDYSGGKKKRKINNLTKNEWAEIIEKVKLYLINEHKYQVNRLSQRETEMQTNTIIFELVFNDLKYYIVESGSKNYFPLFTNQRREDIIEYNVIKDIINIINKEFKGSWLVLSRKKSLKNIDDFSKIKFLEENDIVFLRNNTHQIIGEGKIDSIDQTAKNLANKIHKKILKDIKGIT